MQFAKYILATVAVITALSAFLADVAIPGLAAQHAFNDSWPPHAKFHDAQYVVMSGLIGAIGFGLAIRATRTRLLLATATVAVPWLGMFGALLFPNTATYDPEYANRTTFVLGLHGQLFQAVVMLALLAAAALIVMRSSHAVKRTAEQGTHGTAGSR